MSCSSWTRSGGCSAMTSRTSSSRHRFRSIVVHIGGLVGQMDRNRCRELDVLLVMAEHPPDLVLGIALVRPLDREQQLGVLDRILHPHAAMAVGAALLLEQVLLRRVVLVNVEPVGEIEADPSER